jgi:hypothetical protein
VTSDVRAYLNGHPEYASREVKVGASYSYEGGPGGRSNKSGEAIDIIAGTGLGTFNGPQRRDHNFIPVESALLLSGELGSAFDPVSIALGTGKAPETPFDEIHFLMKRLSSCVGSADEGERRAVALEHRLHPAIHADRVPRSLAENRVNRAENREQA